MLILRFDFRLKPDSPATMQELYNAALDMCQWGERNNAVTAMFSEHHSSPDGYLPSPIIMAAAAAARTETLTFNVGALLLLMYDPIKLAEDSTIMKETFGEELHSKIIANKKLELEKSRRQVTDFELDNYLTIL